MIFYKNNNKIEKIILFNFILFKHLIFNNKIKIMSNNKFTCFNCFQEDILKNESKMVQTNLFPDKNEYDKIIKNIILNQENKLKDNDYICINCIKYIYEQINKIIKDYKSKINEKENALKYLIIQLEKENILNKENELQNEIEKLKEENQILENKINNLMENKNN